MATIPKAIRLKDYSLSTKRSYMDWAMRFFYYADNMKGGNIREILPLLGHQNAETTMIFTDVIRIWRQHQKALWISSWKDRENP